MPPRPSVAARAREHILDAAVASLAAQGAAALAMHDVAARAEVSKGLIHYHYRDKDALLAASAGRLAARIDHRARAALAGSTTERAMDDLARWIASEVAAGEWRALVALATWPAPAVSKAARQGIAEQQAGVTTMLARLFGLLGLEPRIALPQIAELVGAAVSGIAASAMDETGMRTATDVLALALIGLAR